MNCLPRVLHQHPLTEGDIRIGYEAALSELKKSDLPVASDVKVYVNSSAAGGLRMTVHGLTYSMTARAAREAALGAGAIVKMVTAGLLDDFCVWMRFGKSTPISFCLQVE